MTVQPIPQFVAALVQAWNGHDPERAATFYGDDFHGVDVAMAEPLVGPQGMKTMLATYWRAFPDLQFADDRTVVQENQVCVLWTARGTHCGPILSIPATGRPVEVRGVTWLTLNDGKISQALSIWDVAGLLRSLGLLPDL